MSPPILRFVQRGQLRACAGVPPDRTLLELLREDLHCTAVKEGCASGDCGACTVTLAERGEDGRLRYQAINSCIRLAHSVDGMALWTAEDIAAADGTLHPAQRAMLECHGSQCGFCTPGFVMSLFTLQRQHGDEPVTRDEALHALSGNLCRCTGYRPILDAAQTMHHWPASSEDEATTLAQLEALAQTDDTPALATDPAAAFYARPRTLAELLALRAAHPQALLAAGTTDVGLWITKQQRRFAQIIDVTRVAELRGVERGEAVLTIGAAASLTEAFDALAEDRPQLMPFFERFAGRPVRNSGTLGGNVANGSPIGDSMPLLIALGATLVLASAEGERRLPIEDFYLAYRQTALAPHEVLRAIEVPRPRAGEYVQAWKISKRIEDDIAAVCLALALQLDGDRVLDARIGAGGVAAVPARAVKAEAALRGQRLDAATLDAAAEVLRGEFTPISDMRASGDYRRQVLGNLLQRVLDEVGPDAEPALAALESEPAR